LLVLEEVGDVDDVLVRQLADGARLREEALHHRSVGGILAAQHLERDALAELDVLREVDAADRPIADQLDDAITADDVAGRESDGARITRVFFAFARDHGGDVALIECGTGVLGALLVRTATLYTTHHFEPRSS